MNTIPLRQKRAAILSEARSILDVAINEKRQNTPEEVAAFDAKHAEARGLLETIERAESQARLEAATAQPVGGADPSMSDRAIDARKKEPGHGIADAIRCAAYAKNNGGVRAAAVYAEETLKNPELARALGASTGAGGGFAVPSILSTEFIEYLRPASVVRAAGPRILPMPNGNLSIPRVTGGASATYLGENTNITATQQTFGQVKLTAKKLAALIPISNDLIRYANPMTDGVIRQDLVLSVAQAEDLNFLRGDGTQFAPKGMKNWAASGNAVTASDTYDIAHVTADLGSAVGNLLTNNVKVTLDTGAFFMSARTFTSLKFLRNPTTGQWAFPEMQGAEPRLVGYRVFYTSQIPVNLTATPSGGSQISTCSEICFANMTDVVIGETANLILDVSNEAAYVDAGGTTVSAFAQDQTVIRVIEENDFAIRYDQSVAVISAVKY